MLSRGPSWSTAISILAFGLLMVSGPLTGQDAIRVTELTPNLLVLATRTGNVIASVGPDGALLVGTPSCADQSRIQSILEQHTKSGVRYVVIAPEDLAHSQGDGGWQKHGAFVAMHENALRRLGGSVMGAPGRLPERLTQLGAERPRVAFSEVLAFDINGDSIHFVHMKAGYSDADMLVHFHVANVFYLGEAFPGDGYPRIDAQQGGTLAGLLDQLVWTDPRQRIVPARGKVVDGTGLKAYRDMIISIRDSVQSMIKQGRSEAQILAAHPSAKFDAEWGHGRVSPDEFVREIYEQAMK